MHDALDHPCEVFKSVQHFGFVFVPIVNTAYAGNDVAKAPFRNVRVLAGAAHETARCASKIVDRPAGYAAVAVEPRLVIRKPPDRLFVAGNKEIIAALNRRLKSKETVRT
jgi:hypothetical protein